MAREIGRSAVLLAEVFPGCWGGTSTLDPVALLAASPGSAGLEPTTLDEMLTGMVHDGATVLQGGAGGLREVLATLAATRGRAEQDGPPPLMFFPFCQPRRPDVVVPEMTSEPACHFETPEWHAQAHAVPHRRVWEEAERTEFEQVASDEHVRGYRGRGLQQRGTNIVSAEWVYTLKVDEVGHVWRAKALFLGRRVAQVGSPNMRVWTCSETPRSPVLL